MCEGVCSQCSVPVTTNHGYILLQHLRDALESAYHAFVHEFNPLNALSHMRPIVRDVANRLCQHDELDVVHPMHIEMQQAYTCLAAACAAACERDAASEGSTILRWEALSYYILTAYTCDVFAQHVSIVAVSAARHWLDVAVQARRIVDRSVRQSDPAKESEFPLSGHDGSDAPKQALKKTTELQGMQFLRRLARNAGFCLESVNSHAPNSTLELLHQVIRQCAAHACEHAETVGEVELEQDAHELLEHSETSWQRIKRDHKAQ